jgi:hypothetical protein
MPRRRSSGRFISNCDCSWPTCFTHLCMPRNIAKQKTFGRRGVNRDWRFYFNIVDDAYVIRDLIPHPK